MSGSHLSAMDALIEDRMDEIRRELFRWAGDRILRLNPSEPCPVPGFFHMDDQDRPYMITEVPPQDREAVGQKFLQVTFPDDSLYVARAGAAMHFDKNLTPYLTRILDSRLRPMAMEQLRQEAMKEILAQPRVVRRTK